MAMASLYLIFKKPVMSINMRTGVLILLCTLQHQHYQGPNQEDDQTKPCHCLKTRPGVSGRLCQLVILTHSGYALGTSLISTISDLQYAISRDNPRTAFTQNLRKLTTSRAGASGPALSKILRSRS